ncbi:MAG: DUF11 domain-containing protein [Candidatus Doudnabacteria bacterium]|nr:DUF11 domain-containing protein [Candidatus Doudnabacteria bacterium]
MAADLNNPFIIPPSVHKEKAEQRNWLSRVVFPTKWLVVIIAVIVVLLGVLFWMLRIIPAPPPKPEVRLWFDTPETVTSGSAAEFSVIYENLSKEELQSVLLEVVYPDNFQFLTSEPESADHNGRSFSIGSLDGEKTGIIKIVGIFSGSPEEIKILKGRLFFGLKEQTAQFSSSGESRFSLQAPDFNLRIVAPPQVVAGQKLDYQISFQNISDTDLNRVQLKVKYPGGFVFSKATLPSKDNETWEIGRMAIGKEALLTISGLINGAAGEEKIFRVDVGYVSDSGEFVLQNRGYLSISLLPSPLTVTNSSNRSPVVNEGESITYSIRYRNDGQLAMQNVKIIIKMDGAAIDFTSLRAEGGALVGKDVVWNPSGVSKLRILNPGDSGELTMTYQLKENLASLGLINPSVTTKIFISSMELPEPVGGQELTFKVKSKLVLLPDAVYVSGPIKPLVAGEASVFRIKFLLKNGVNALSEAVWQGVINIPAVDVIESSLPANVFGREFKFSQESGHLTWNIGDVEALAARAIEFEVRVVPSVLDLKSDMLLLKDLEASARDTFVNQNIAGKYHEGLRVRN